MEEIQWLILDPRQWPGREESSDMTCPDTWLSGVSTLSVSTRAPVPGDGKETVGWHAPGALCLHAAGRTEMRIHLLFWLPSDWAWGWMIRWETECVSDFGLDLEIEGSSVS